MAQWIGDAKLIDIKSNLQLRRHYIRLFDGSGTEEDGEIVLQDLMNRFYRHSPTFVKGDPYNSALNEGGRCVLLHIESMLSKEEYEEKKRKEGENEVG